MDWKVKLPFVFSINIFEDSSFSIFSDGLIWRKFLFNIKNEIKKFKYLNKCGLILKDTLPSNSPVN